MTNEDAGKKTMRWHGRSNQSTSGRYRAFYHAVRGVWMARREGREGVFLGEHPSREAAKTACLEHWREQLTGVAG